MNREDKFLNGCSGTWIWFVIVITLVALLAGCSTNKTAARKDTYYSVVDGLAVDSKGDVYAVSAHTCSVQKFDSSGRLVARWGSTGNSDRRFAEPRRITLDGMGNVYVGDGFVGVGVQKLTPSGKFLTSWRLSGEHVTDPEGIAASPKGDLYAIPSSGENIQKFDSSGRFISKLGSRGTGNGQFVMPTAIAVDTAGNVYVAESSATATRTASGGFTDGKTTTLHGAARIQKFGPSGKFLAVCVSKGIGKASLFWSPNGIAVDTRGNIYVLGEYSVKKYSPSGKFLTKWGKDGHDRGEFVSAASIAVDPQGNVYVGDGRNSRIQKFDSSGKFLLQWTMKQQ